MTEFGCEPASDAPQPDALPMRPSPMLFSLGEFNNNCSEFFFQTAMRENMQISKTGFATKTTLAKLTFDHK
jgi:hypothetical protein